MENMDYQLNFVHNGNSILFNNNVNISKSQFDALNRVRGQYTCSTTSFIWNEMLNIPEGEDSLSVNYEKFSYKRIKNELEFLADCGFFTLETKEVSVKNRTKLEIKLSAFNPAIRSIIHLM